MVNPLFFCYGSTANVEAYAAPTAVFVTGEGNRHAPAFQRAREKGAEVLTYLDIPERPDSTTNPIIRELYLGDPARVPLWGNGRRSWPGKMLTDMRVGSPWVDHAVEYIANLMRSGEFDGVFLDVVGAQLWSAAKWDDWSAEEQQEWTIGNVDFVRRLHLQRLEINPDFIIVNNNLWHVSRGGEQYVNGVCVELPTAGLGQFHRNYVARDFGVPSKRRMFLIARTGEGALWAQAPGVTHVVETSVYKAATPPVVPYMDLRLPELRATVARLRSDGTAMRIDLARAIDAAETAIGERNELAGSVKELKDKLAQIHSISEVA